MLTRRTLMQTGLAATLLPASAKAASDTGDRFGDLSIHPVAHSSFVIGSPVGALYFDPVGAMQAYADLPEAAVIFITHEHGDHYDAALLTALAKPETKLVVNPAVMARLPADLAARATEIANGQSIDLPGIELAAIGAYNTTPARLRYHPEGRDNGYVLNVAGQRVYVAGDTEDIPEMRALTGIDLAFIPMNLPFTMDVAAAADAVREFKPAHVYPYHYNGQDPEEFASLVGDAAEVHFGAWY